MANTFSSHVLFLGEKSVRPPRDLQTLPDHRHTQVCRCWMVTIKMLTVVGKRHLLSPRLASIVPEPQPTPPRNDPGNSSGIYISMEDSAHKQYQNMNS